MILIAPDKFKGTLTAKEVCEALARGLRKCDPALHIELHPLADGGDGSLEILSNYMDLKTQTVPCQGPLGRPIEARYYTSDKAAFIELAAASGYVLLKKEEKNPLLTSTYGTGQMMRHALEAGFEEIYLFLGGSATSEAGIGMATALGFSFLDKNGKRVKPIGQNLSEIHSIDASQVLFDFSNIKITALCDVANPLHGKNGAAYVYAPQKGADAKAVAQLDKGLKNVATVVEQQFGIDLQSIVGGGAAGGIAAGLVGFCNAQLVEGTKTIMQLTDFEEKAKRAEWILSGEGQLDASTLQGKVSSGVVRWAKQNGKKSALFVGRNALSKEKTTELAANHIAAVLDAAPSVEAAMADGGRYLEALAEAFWKMKRIEKS